MMMFVFVFRANYLFTSDAAAHPCEEDISRGRQYWYRRWEEEQAYMGIFIWHRKAFVTTVTTY